MKYKQNHLILTRRPDLIIINKKLKKKCLIVDFAVPTHHKVKIIESENRDKYLDLTRKLTPPKKKTPTKNKTMGHEAEGR